MHFETLSYLPTVDCWRALERVVHFFGDMQNFYTMRHLFNMQMLFSHLCDAIVAARLTSNHPAKWLVKAYNTPPQSYVPQVRLSNYKIATKFIIIFTIYRLQCGSFHWRPALSSTILSTFYFSCRRKALRKLKTLMQTLVSILKFALPLALECVCVCCLCMPIGETRIMGE